MFGWSMSGFLVGSLQERFYKCLILQQQSTKSPQLLFLEHPPFPWPGVAFVREQPLAPCGSASVLIISSMLLLLPCCGRDLTPHWSPYCCCRRDLKTSLQTNRFETFLFGYHFYTTSLVHHDIFFNYHK